MKRRGKRGCRRRPPHTSAKDNGTSTQGKDQRTSELEHKVSELSALLSSVHAEMMAGKNAPSAIESHIPGQHDPAEQMKAGHQAEGGRSSLDLLPDVPRRKRGHAQSPAETTAS